MLKQLKVTMRQELFLREYMKTANATEAWRRIYKNKNPSDTACRALKKPHVQKRFNQLLERQMKRSDITVDKVLADYQYALNLAKEQGKAAEVVGAASAQAKLVGLLRDRVETGQVGDFSEGHSIADILELVAKEAGAEAAASLASMFGMQPVELEQQTTDISQLLSSDPPTGRMN